METNPLNARTRSIGPVDFLVAVTIAAFSVCAMLGAWRDSLRIGFKDEECSYVLIAPGIIAWLCWVRRGRLIDCPVRGGWVGLLILLAGWGVYWYGYLTDPVIWRAGAVIVAAGALVAGIGFDAALRLAPALAVCVFLVPVDPNGRYRVAEPLQTVTADVTQVVCDILGMGVERSGNLLSVNGVDVTIAEACNGMRMVLTLFLVCYVVAFTLPLRPWLRIVFLAASPVVAIVSNTVRLVPTLWMFGHTSARSAEQFHDISGWVMTVMAFVALMTFLRPFRQSAASRSSGAVGPSHAERPPASTTRMAANAYRIIAVVIIAAIATHGYFAIHQQAGVERYQQRIREVAAGLPLRVGSWVGQDVDVPAQSYTVLKPNVMISRHYVDIESGATAGVLLVHCADAHHMVGHYPLRCYPAQGWQVRSTRPRDWTVGDQILSGTEYEFYRTAGGDSSSEETMVVANCLFRPGGKILRDMDGLTSTIIGAGGSSSGAGQLQVYFDATVPPAQRDTAIVQIMSGYRPLIDAILADPATGDRAIRVIGAARP